MLTSWRMLREERDLRLLITAGFVSGLGDWFHTVAVLALIFMVTGSGLAVGLTLALKVIPRIALSGLAGAMADRFSRLRIAAACDLLRIPLVLSLLMAISADRVWLIYVATTLLVVCDTFENPARQAAIPSLVREEHLAAANGLSQAFGGIVMIVGSAVGGLAVAAFGPGVAFEVDAASFLASGLLILAIRTQVKGAARVTTPPGELLAAVRGSRMLQALLALVALWPLGGGAVNVLLSVYAVRVFHAGSQGIGILYMAIGVGLLAGGSLAGPLAKRLGRGAVFGFLTEGICHMLVSQAPTLAAAALLLTCATFGAGVGNVCVSTLLMRSVEKALLGRLFAVVSALSSTVMALSMLGTGLAVGAWPARLLGLVAGALVAGAGLLGAGGLRWAAQGAVADETLAPV